VTLPSHQIGLRTELIDGATVVTQVLDPDLRAANWKVGDVILKVGNLDIRAYAEANVAPYVSSSTNQDREVRTFNYSLLSGDVSDPLVLTAEDAVGERQVRTSLNRLPVIVYVASLARLLMVASNLLVGDL
jgi:hypothetical protein